MTNHLSVNWTQRMSHCDFQLHLRCQPWRAGFCFAFIKTESKIEGFCRQKLKKTFGPKMGDFKLYNTWYKSWISKFPIEENYFLARNSQLLSDYQHWPSCAVTSSSSSSSSSSFIHTYSIAIQHICNTSHVHTDQVRSDKAHYVHKRF